MSRQRSRLLATARDHLEQAHCIGHCARTGDRGCTHWSRILVHRRLKCYLCHSRRSESALWARALSENDCSRLSRSLLFYRTTLCNALALGSREQSQSLPTHFGLDCTFITFISIAFIGFSTFPKIGLDPDFVQHPSKSGGKCFRYVVEESDGKKCTYAIYPLNRVARFQKCQSSRYYANF